MGARSPSACRPGTFKSPVQITITAPSVSGIGDGGHPGYHAVCGVGVGITVNGKAYTGAYGHSLVLIISGLVRPGDRVAEFNGKTFAFVGAIVQGFSALISFQGSGEDFAVLAPGGGGGGVNSPSRGVNAAVRTSHGAREKVLTSLFLRPASQSPAGIGVLAPEWLTVISR